MSNQIATTFYVRRGDQVRGPVTGSQLKAMAGEGRIQATDEVGKLPTGPWQVAHTVRGLSFPVPDFDPLPTQQPQVVFVPSPAPMAQPVIHIVNNLQSTSTATAVATVNDFGGRYARDGKAVAIAAILAASAAICTWVAELPIAGVVLALLGCLFSGFGVLLSFARWGRGLASALLVFVAAFVVAMLSVPTNH